MSKTINPSAEARNMMEEVNSLRQSQWDKLIQTRDKHITIVNQIQDDLASLAYPFQLQAEPEKFTAEEWANRTKENESIAISQVQSELIDKNNRIVFLQKEIFSLRNKIEKSKKKSTTKKTTKKK